MLFQQPFGTIGAANDYPENWQIKIKSVFLSLQELFFPVIKMVTVGGEELFFAEVLVSKDSRNGSSRKSLLCGVD